MIQTPILDNALQATKDPGPSTNYPPTKRPSASGSASTLKERLETQRNSQALSIVDLFIGDEGAYEIAKFLKQNKEFSSIQLRGNNISAAGFEAICQALKGFNRLRDITAEWNNIGSDISGLVALHQVLKSNTSVEVVDLKNNRLGPSSGRVVGDIIRDSNSLKKIDLRWNELGSEGGQAILRALQESNRSVTVDLSGNKIPEDILAQIDEVSSSKTVTRITASVPQTTQKSFGQSQTFATPSVEYKTSGAQEIKPRFSNSAFPSKYGNTKPYGSTLRQATPPRESHQQTHQQTLTVNTNLQERPVQRSSALGTVSENTRKYSYLTENKSYNAAPNVTYSSPKRRTTDRHDGNVDDIIDRIEATKQNIERFSPKQNEARKENFRHDPVSRSTYDIKQELSRRGPELNSTYKYRQVQMTPGVTEIRNDTTLRRSVNVRSDVKDIHVHHEADEGNLKVGKLISDLERMLEKEQIRAIEAEARFNALANDFEMEQVIKQDLEKKHSHILDELRRRDSEVNELRAALDDFERENISLKADVNRLNIENERLDQFNKVGLADLEDKYISQLKQADAHSHSLRVQLDNVQQDLNGQLLDMRRELDDRCRNYEDQILEFSKMNDELSAELASQLEFIEKLKVEHEEHMRRTVNQVREEEIHKAQIVIRDLEGQLAAMRAANEDLTARNAEMLQDLQSYEKQIREQHIQFANELARLGAELDRLRAELNNANGIIQRQNGDLAARDSTIHQLQGDIERLRIEIQRLTDAHVLQIDNLRRDFDGERRRFADNERQLIMNIEDLERRLVESQNETIVITKEYDRLVEIIKGNVTKAIHDTFVSHKNTSEIRHIEHRTTVVPRPLFK